MTDLPRLLLPILSSHASGKFADDLGHLAECEGWAICRLDPGQPFRFLSNLGQSLRDAVPTLAVYPGSFPSVLKRFGPLAMRSIASLPTHHGAKKAAWIDDRPSLQATALGRKVKPASSKAEHRLLSRFSSLVVQHEAMAIDLAPASHIVESGPLPYLSTTDLSRHFGHGSLGTWSILYAGSLAFLDCTRLPRMAGANFLLVGPGQPRIPPPIGTLTMGPMGHADLETKAAEADFGLLCYPQAMSDYLSRTYTAKLSFYLARGLPVLVSNTTVLAASFVEDSGAGIIFETADDLADALNQLTPSQYRKMRAAAWDAGTPIRTGSACKAALRKVRAMIEP